MSIESTTSSSKAVEEEVRHKPWRVESGDRWKLEVNCGEWRVETAAGAAVEKKITSKPFPTEMAEGAAVEKEAGGKPGFPL